MPRHALIVSLLVTTWIAFCACSAVPSLSAFDFPSGYATHVIWVTDKSVFVRADNGLVYLSTNAGRTFTALTDMPASSDSVSFKSTCAEGTSVKACGVDRLYLANPSFSSYVLMSSFAGNASNFWCLDASGNVLSHRKGFPLVGVKIHPAVDTVVAGAVAQTDAAGPLLVLSTDRGLSWSVVLRSGMPVRLAVASSYSEIYWAAPAGSSGLATSHEHNRRLFVQIDEADGSVSAIAIDLPPWGKGVTKHGPEFYAVTPVATSVIARDLSHIGRVDGFLFAVVKDPGTTLLSLLVSNSNGDTMRHVKLPHAVTQTGYTVLSTDHGALFLHVDAGGSASALPWGPTYISDATGGRMQTSLLRNRRNMWTVDFHKAGGLPGVLIANILSGKSWANPLCRYCRDFTGCSNACSFTTVISWNKGRSWFQPVLSGDPIPVSVDPRTFGMLRAPPSSTVNTSNHLHLHGGTSRSSLISAIWSSAEVPGLIIAQGNTGDELDTVGASVSVFISRDAGRTWRFVLDGAYLYHGVAAGGFLLFAKRGSPQDEVYYSLDEGATLKPLALEGRDATMAYTLYAMVSADTISPSGTIAKNAGAPGAILLFAMEKGLGTVIGINAASSEPRLCVLGRDYEEWSETAPGECVLGAKTTYLRRKEAAACWDPPSLTVRLARQPIPCECTAAADFDCDIGFVADSNNEKCIRDNSVSIQDGVCDKTTGLMTKTKGYMRIPGDICIRDKFSPEVVPCGGPRRGWVAFLTIFFVISIVFVVLFLGGKYLHATNPVFRDKIESFLDKYFPNWLVGIEPPSDYDSVPRYTGHDEDFFDQVADDASDLDHEDDRMALGGNADHLLDAAMQGTPSKPSALQQPAPAVPRASAPASAARPLASAGDADATASPPTQGGKIPLPNPFDDDFDL